MPLRHQRPENTGQPSTPDRSRRPRPLVTAGVGMAALGVTLGATLWPAAGPQASVQPAAAAADEQQDAARRAAAGRAAAALRIEERTSRDRSRTSPAAPAVRAAAAAPRPAPVPSIVGRKWVTRDVNVRSGPSAGSDRIDGLAARARTGVTGLTRSGWTQVVVDGRAGWVRSTFLSTTKPESRTSKTSRSAARRAPAGVSDARCRKSRAIEPHLTANARAVYRAVCATYGGSVSSFGGYRPGDPRDHGTGRAVDIMVSGAPGTRIARYVQRHARELGVTYVIYQQRIWMAGDPAGRWKFMADRGGATANHYDHVHVSVR